MSSISLTHSSRAPSRNAVGLALASFSQIASSLLLALAGIVGWAWMVCLQDATACCALALLAPPPPVVAAPGARVAGVEGVPATVGLDAAGARAGVRPSLECTFAVAEPVPAAGPLAAAAELGGESVLAAAWPVLAVAPVRAAGPVRAAAGLLGVAVELV